MKQIAVLAAGLVVASLAQANIPVLVNFETPTSFSSILEHYNGGTDLAGLAGTNLGVSFTIDALALQNTDPAFPSFTNAPSPIGVMAPSAPLVGQTNATMNVAAGFTGTVSLWYTADKFLLQGVNVYSDLNGTGTLLASFNLVANAQADGCSSAPYCRFDQISSTFAGVAKSITFGNAADHAAFDNIRITAVPEPTLALMMSVGLAALALVRRRR